MLGSIGDGLPCPFLVARQKQQTPRREQHDLAAYVLTVDKSGSNKLMPSTSTNRTSLEFSFAPNGIVLGARNAAPDSSVK
jgi:hypothetical protein